MKQSHLASTPIIRRQETAARQRGNVFHPSCRRVTGVFDSIIIRKGNKYLSLRYRWQHAPELFPDWQLKTIAGVVRGRFEFALVDAGRVIDMDELQWMKG